VNQRYTKGWQETDEIPGWGIAKNIMVKVLEARNG